MKEMEEGWVGLGMCEGGLWKSCWGNWVGQGGREGG